MVVSKCRSCSVAASGSVTPPQRTTPGTTRRCSRTSPVCGSPCLPLPFDAKWTCFTTRFVGGEDPVLFLEHRELLTQKGPVPPAAYEIPFGQAAVIREGRDATVVALTRMVHKALEAADVLARDGISVEVIDPRTVAPLDVDTIGASVAKTGRLLIADEGFALYGIGAEIAAQIADRYFDELDAPIRRVNGLHTPTPYSPPLEAAVVPDTEALTNAIRVMIAE